MTAAEEAESTDVWSLLRAIEVDPERSQVERTIRVLTVHRPWAWLMWQDGLLQTIDPDEQDDRSAREISTLGVEWGLVLYAASYAVMQLGLPDEVLLHLDSVDVEVPFPLSEDEWRLAQSWVGEHSPVMIQVNPDDLTDFESPGIEDGRHRLWLTRKHEAQFGAPVLAESLLYVGQHLKGELRDLMPLQVTLDALDDAVQWWETHPRESVRTGYCDTHLRMMAHAVVALAMAPITTAWFKRFAPWDGWIAQLAALHQGGQTDVLLLEDVLGTAWRDKQDDVHVDPVVLRSMFAMLGFSVNGIPTRPPRARTLTLYRGSTEGGRPGPSWTVDPDTARYFAGSRQEPGQQASVWQVRVHSSHVLAVMTDENECIVDLDGLADPVVPAPVNAKPAKSTLRWIHRSARGLPSGM